MFFFWNLSRDFANQKRRKSTKTRKSIPVCMTPTLPFLKMNVCHTYVYSIEWLIRIMQMENRVSQTYVVFGLHWVRILRMNATKLTYVMLNWMDKTIRRKEESAQLLYHTVHQFCLDTRVLSGGAICHDSDSDSDPYPWSLRLVRVRVMTLTPSSKPCLELMDGRP